MADKYILVNREPVPCDDVHTWGRAFETADRQVAVTKVSDSIKVSTVFLGLDHSFGNGTPLLFETMVFGGSLDGEQERYSTWAEAEAGHAAMLARVRSAEPEAVAAVDPVDGITTG